MTKQLSIYAAALAIFFTSCGNDKNENIVTQKFIHKYGFGLSEKEWNEREQDGQVITMLKNGVTVTQNYENGVLHGTTTHSFPDSTVVEKLHLYDQGNLLKEVLHDEDGIPYREDVYEFDNRQVITLWDKKGAPMSIEELKDNLLIEGKYFHPNSEVEATVHDGKGERVRRNRRGLLLLKDTIEQGQILTRLTYHPSGTLQSESHYKDYQLHGEQVKYHVSGRPLMSLHWKNGVLDGMKTIYQNGNKVMEVPYVMGKKHGVEKHFNEKGDLTTEIQWEDDQKHGSSRFYSEEDTRIEWFYKGRPVSVHKFEILDREDKLLYDFEKTR